MKDEQYLVRILPPLAFLAACMVLISALIEPLFSFNLAKDWICIGIGCLVFQIPSTQ